MSNQTNLPKNTPSVEYLLDNVTEKFISSLKGSKPISTLAINDARDILNKIQKDESYKTLVDISEIDIIGDEINVNINIFRPKNNKNRLPIIFYIHGGGWILGNNQTHGRLVTEICTKTNSTVVFVNYTPAPEKKYPTQILQSLEALKYIYNNSDKLYLDPNNIIIMGDSVGGNMATVVTMLSHEKGGPKIKYQILTYPVTDAAMDTQSYEIYSNGPWLTKLSMRWFFDAYENDSNLRSNPTISPLRASIKNIQNLPPTLIITGENDVLRDEGEKYAHKLMQAGIDVSSVRILGVIHDFLMLDPVKNSPGTKIAMDLVIKKIKEVFDR
ncbi:triacylglycerol lipase [Moumouvirus goulette]|uniref:Triacylglycerol lipase n=1 Tax=Moumouvirus goulette TaxID=1247379 RepID=M1PGN2_9VIRU|nr:triacylglycerol lipase [Moumouvirus goulette]AGF85168.1 triacylglycerol lipase [Moumouvirus goulette]